MNLLNHLKSKVMVSCISIGCSRDSCTFWSDTGCNYTDYIRSKNMKRHLRKYEYTESS